MTPKPPETVAAPPDPLKRHRLDLDAIENGKWVTIRGDRWKVARIGCAEVARARASAMAARGLAPDAEVPAHLLDSIQGEIFATAILRGMELQDDRAAYYTPEVGRRIWSDPELRGLRDQIIAESDGDYRQEAVAKAALLGN